MKECLSRFEHFQRPQEYDRTNRRDDDVANPSCELNAEGVGQEPAYQGTDDTDDKIHQQALIATHYLFGNETCHEPDNDPKDDSIASHYVLLMPNFGNGGRLLRHRHRIINPPSPQ
jgi:hypothetical protein